ncbi:hypothetical protein E143388_07046 [Rhodococcus opacus]|nr:hypothetical protein E143388_07046 [Rhodococcus opacus]
MSECDLVVGRSVGDEREPEQGWRGQVERGGAVGGDDVVSDRPVAFVAEIVVIPGKCCRSDDLNRCAVGSVAESGAEVRVTAEKGVRGVAEAVGVEGSVDVEDELHDVGVEGLAGQFVVEQQTGLQGGEGPDVGEGGVVVVECVEGGLVEVDEVEVAGGEPAGAGSADVVGEGGEGFGPQVGELGDVGRREHTGRIHPGGAHDRDAP